MALVRILVDGYNLINAIYDIKQDSRYNQEYSLLHSWPELAPGQPRHSAGARDELVALLTRYHDAMGTPMTIFFDGSGAPGGTPKNESNRAVEVLFSRAGQTADDMIERAAHRFQDYGEVLVVTNDRAERDTVSGFGGSVASCENFIRQVGGVLLAEQDELKRHNRKEQNQFNRPRGI